LYPGYLAVVLDKAVGRTHFRKAQYLNRFGKRSGHPWQGRFYSCALDAWHFWLAMKYMELNPVRARLCRKPWRYEWSSAAAHVDAQIEADVLGKRTGKRGQVQPATEKPSAAIRACPEQAEGTSCEVPAFLDLSKWFRQMAGEIGWQGLADGLQWRSVVSLSGIFDA